VRSKCSHQSTGPVAAAIAAHDGKVEQFTQGSLAGRQRPAAGSMPQQRLSRAPAGRAITAKAIDAAKYATSEHCHKQDEGGEVNYNERRRETTAEFFQGRAAQPQPADDQQSRPGGAGAVRRITLMARKAMSKSNP